MNYPTAPEVALTAAALASDGDRREMRESRTNRRKEIMQALVLNALELHTIARQMMLGDDVDDEPTAPPKPEPTAQAEDPWGADRVPE